MFVGDDEDGRRAELLAVAVGIRKLGGFLHGGSRSWQQENRDVVPRHVIHVVEGIVPKWGRLGHPIEAVGSGGPDVAGLAETPPG